ncbi:MAG: SprT-like domain-containing protein [Bdellovibrionota bacterium]
MMSGTQLSLFDHVISKLPFFGKRKQTTRSSNKSRSRPKTSNFSDDPKLKLLWCQLRREFFPDRPDLDNYTVYWSGRRQIRTLASCNIEDKRIAVAKELNYLEQNRWLSPLLYHEMCHAYLGHTVAGSRGKRGRWHGKEFRELEARHPGVKELDRWIRGGGWSTAVRSSRAKEYHLRKRKNAA